MVCDGKADGRFEASNTYRQRLFAAYTLMERDANREQGAMSNTGLSVWSLITESASFETWARTPTLRTIRWPLSAAL